MNERLGEIEGRLQQAVSDRVFPGCSVAYVEGNEVEARGIGHFTYEADSPLVTPETIYDTASLTKVLTVMALAAQLVDEGVLELEQPVTDYLPEFGKDARVAHLMTYTLNYNVPGGAKSLMSGQPPEEIARNMITMPLKEPAGTSYMYSNITAFILTQLVERVTGENFEKLVRQRVFRPLKMNTATFSPSAEQVESIPPTEVTEERGLVQGFVHDESTYYVRQGGFRSGAASLFASVLDIAEFLKMTINNGYAGDKKLYSENMVKLWTGDYFPKLLPVHTPVGWGDPNNQLIDNYHRDIVVKGGFTGCFMMADLKQKRALVLLSNRIYPKRPEDASAFAAVKEDIMKIVLS